MAGVLSLALRAVADLREVLVFTVNRSDHLALAVAALRERATDARMLRIEQRVLRRGDEQGRRHSAGFHSADLRVCRRGQTMLQEAAQGTKGVSKARAWADAPAASLA